jgi:hypothetical protein
MRKITALQIAVFLSIYGVAILASIATTGALLGFLPLGDFRGVILSVTGVILFFAWLIAFYHLFLKFMPLGAGPIEQGSRKEFIYHVYVLFFLMGFYMLTRSGSIPVPLMRMIYVALGARLGKNTYTAGIIYDPIFIKVGDNTLMGQSSLLIPHAIENEFLSHEPIVIGDNVTIGAMVIILQGVKIGNNALVASGSVVTKGTVIGDNEIWGGVPARFLKKKENQE